MTRPPLRIIHVIPSLAVRMGGPAVSLVGLATALQTLGADVSVLAIDTANSPKAPTTQRATMKDLPAGCQELDVRLFPAQFPRRFAYAPELQRALVREMDRTDVVHIHTLFLHPQYAAWRAASQARIPWVVSPKGALDPYLRRRGRLRKKATDLLWQRRMLDGAAALHLTSDDERRLVADLAICAPECVIPNGIDTNLYAALPPPHEFRDRFLQGTDGPVILNHGRLTQKKGLDILIAAFARLRPAFPDARLVLVGPDDEGYGAYLRSVAETCGVAQQVVFTDILNGRDLLGALAATDVWALPSHTENFGMAVVEAMAASRAVVTSPQVNIAPDAHAAGALLMVRNEPEDVAAAIAQLLTQPADRHRLGQRAQEYARRFDWNAVGHQFFDLYESIARSREQRTCGKSSAWMLGAINNEGGPDGAN